jgi:hypothetical protein
MSDLVPVRVTARPDGGFWRAGMKWTKEPIKIELPEETVQILEAEDKLIVSRLETIDGEDAIDLEAENLVLKNQIEVLKQQVSGLESEIAALKPGHAPDSLPEGFPGKAELEAAGYKSLSGLTDTKLEDLTAVTGIGVATANKILEALKVLLETKI